MLKQEMVPIPRRSSFSDWNYQAEIKAFQARIGEMVPIPRRSSFSDWNYQA